MFKRLFTKEKKQKNLEKVENKFTFFTFEEDNKKFIARFRPSLWNIAYDNIYPYLVGIAIPIINRSNIFPSGAENKMLLMIEDKIANSLEKDCYTIYAGTIIGDGMKEFVFYTSSPENVKKNLKKLAKDIKGYEIQMDVEEDKEWNFFKTNCPQLYN